MGTAMAQAAGVCLEEIPHAQGTELAVRGRFTNSYGLEWNEVTEQGRRTFADLREATEFGAEGVAILLIKEETDYTTIERAAIGTRIDRWLGHESDAPDFQRRARLETSGILRGSDADIRGETARENGPAFPVRQPAARICRGRGVQPSISRGWWSMNNRTNHHQQAMDLVEAAILERMRGNLARTEELYAQALDLELAAIRDMEERNDQSEPTWSVLHRSAGWMALNSHQLRRAEQLAAKGLAGDPHPEIAEELRNLLEQINANRHGGYPTVSNEPGNRPSTDTPASESPIGLADDNRSGPFIESSAPVEILGVLCYADSINNNVIRIVEDSGKDRAVLVPEGMMNDIVRPNWGKRVRITGTQIEGEITLQRILPDDGDSL